MQKIFRGNGNKKVFIALAITTWWFGFGMAASQAQTKQDATATEPESVLESGPMQRVAKSLEPILNIKFVAKDKQVKLDRESWTSNGKEDERTKAMRAQMVARGMDKATIDRMMTQLAKGQRGLGPLNNLFSSLRTEGGMRSYSSSSSNAYVRLAAGSADLNCTIGYSDDVFELKVSEITGPMRTLDVVSKTGLRMLLTGEDSIALIQQTKTGVMGLLIQGEDVQSGKAKDYYDLGIKHPKLQSKLAAKFRHAGVNLPLGINEPEVQEVAFRMLKTLNSSSTSDLAKLMEGLDAPEFEKRETATKAIALVFDQYEGPILKQLEGDELSIESRRRLEKIVKDKNSKQKDSRAQDCVTANKLLSSPKYLVGLMENADPSQLDLLKTQLQKLTGKKFKDVKAWQKWLVETAE